MKKWIPFFVTACIALLCSIMTVITGIIAYLALTGLDLLVTAKKTALPVTVMFAIASFVLWLVALVILLITKPYSKKKDT